MIIRFESKTELVRLDGAAVLYFGEVNFDGDDIEIALAAGGVEVTEDQPPV